MADGAHTYQQGQLFESVIELQGEGKALEEARCSVAEGTCRGSREGWLGETTN